MPLTQVCSVTLGRLHVFPQVPQCSISVLVLTSHPLLAIPSQSPHPLEQAATVHWPWRQPCWDTCASTHLLLHSPQWLVSVFKSLSQPL